MGGFRSLLIIILLLGFLLSACSGKASQKNVIPPRGNNGQLQKIDVTGSPNPFVSPESTSAPVVQTNIDVPVLNYHAVSNDTFGITELFIKPAEFDKQMKYLQEEGYTPVQFEGLDSLTSIRKPIIITFDDGYSDNYTNAYPILKRYNFKAVIFPIIQALNGPKYLTIEQINKMKDLISFQNHTITHRKLINLSNEEIEEEISFASRQLELITGQEVIALAYPIGKYDDRVKDIAKKHVRYGITIKTGLYKTGNDPFEIKRLYIKRSDSLDNFIKKLKR